jgi:hypothetical protein
MWDWQVLASGGAPASPKRPFCGFEHRFCWPCTWAVSGWRGTARKCCRAAMCMDCVDTDVVVLARVCINTAEKDGVGGRTWIVLQQLDNLTHITQSVACVRADDRHVHWPCRTGQRHRQGIGARASTIWRELAVVASESGPEAWWKLVLNSCRWGVRQQRWQRGRRRDRNARSG